MPVLAVKRLPSTDAGRLIVRLHSSHRNGIRRYGIAKITNSENKLSILALVLGHDDKEAIFMPHDIRTAIGPNKGAQLSFDIAPVGLLGKLNWYVQSPDPAVHLPAWLAVFSVCLGVFGVVLAAQTLS